MQSANVRERLEGLGAVIVPPVHATPRISFSVCAQRDREMDGPDQGERGDRGVSRTVFVGLAHARKRNGPGPCLRWKGAKIFIGCTRSGASVTRNDRPYRAERGYSLRRYTQCRRARPVYTVTTCHRTPLECRAHPIPLQYPPQSFTTGRL